MPDGGQSKFVENREPMTVGPYTFCATCRWGGH